jgi:hypothetical protein
VEHEAVHGTYWWPLGVASGLGLVGSVLARRGSRAIGGSLAATATALVVDELGAGRRPLRALLPKRTTANVVARAGDIQADRVLLLVSHHDAAHTSIFFDPRITAFVGRHYQVEPGTPPRLPAVTAPIAIAPALVALGAAVRSRALVRLGAWVCAGVIGSFIEMANRKTVPGANDNLTGVATVLAVARAVRQRPLTGLRLLLVSTGAEETHMEGMRAFAQRHFPALDPDRTRVLCVDTVGSPYLVLADAEGMLQVRDYDRQLNELIVDCAKAEGITLVRGLRMRLGTDGYLALRHGIPAAMLTSIDENGGAANYHWPTDTPERVDYARVHDAARLCEAVARRLAAGSAAPPH